LRTFSVSKLIGKNIFLLLTDKKLLTKDSLTEHFVGDFVGKLITNGIIVQIPTENSVGKSKDYGSDTNWCDKI